MSFDGILRASLGRSLQQSKLPFSAGAPAEIYELERHRDHCRHAKDYRAAQQLEDRLNALKDVYEKNEVKELEAQQADELASRDASFQQALHQLLQEWDGRFSELQGLLQEAEQQLVARQAEEATALLAAQAAVQPRPKFSPALLNMRHIERMLAFQKEFSKADTVKQQADQLELLELSQMGADMAGKQEAERAHLAARHSKERDAAGKKAASAVLAAQQRQGYEVEQLSRRYQAVKLSLSRGHAAQRLSLQQGLHGSLGLSRPTQLLGLPSFNSSLTETRGLVRGPVPARGFEAQLPPPSRSVERCSSPLGASGLYRASATTSPPAAAVRASMGSLGGAAKGCGCAGRLCSPHGHQGHAPTCRCNAVTDAAAAAAGYGLAIPPLTAGTRNVTAAYKKGSSSGSKGMRPCTRAGSRGSQSGNFGAGSGGLFRRSSSGGGSLPLAAGAAPALGSAAADKKGGSLRGTWGASSGLRASGRGASSTNGSNSKPGTASSSSRGAGAPLTATTSHSSAGSVAVHDNSDASSHSSLSPWRATGVAPRSWLQNLQGAVAQLTTAHPLQQHVPQQQVPAPAAFNDLNFLPVLLEQQSGHSVGQQPSEGMAAGQLRQTYAEPAGDVASPAPAVDDVGEVFSQVSSNSSQVVQAATGAAKAHAEGAAADGLASAEAAAGPLAATAEGNTDGGAVGLQECPVGVEHSIASCYSDFEEDAATRQAVAADAGEGDTPAATKVEPEAAAAQEAADASHAAELGLADPAWTCRTGSGDHQPSNGCQVDAASAALTATAGQAGVADSMLNSGSIEHDSHTGYSRGDATVGEEPLVRLAPHAGPAPADAVELCDTSEEEMSARVDAEAA